MPTFLPLIALLAVSTPAPAQQAAARPSTPAAASAKLGEWLTFEGGERYRVTGVDHVTSYTERFNQNAAKYRATPGDSLAVVEFEAENSGSDTLLLPGINVQGIDSEGVVSVGVLYDVRQAPQIVAEGMVARPGNNLGLPIARGGKSKFAVVFAVGGKNKVARVQVRRTSGGGFSGIGSASQDKYFEVTL